MLRPIPITTGLAILNCHASAWHTLTRISIARTLGKYASLGSHQRQSPILVTAACSIHVASVLQMTHMLLCHGGIMKSKALSRIHLQSGYWSAITHDYEHGGLNNDFLIKTAHPLAVTYNDMSPLENHHLAASVRVLNAPECWYFPVSCAHCMCTCIIVIYIYIYLYIYDNYISYIL